MIRRMLNAKPSCPRGAHPLGIALVLIAALFPLGAFASQKETAAPGSLERIVLQLKWTHAFQFAGYYAAKELGYYAEAGLEVDIREARSDLDVVAAVVSGEAHYATGSSSLLLDRAQGRPVVVLAVVFQHSPYVLASGGTDTNRSIHDLLGKRVMIETMGAELLAYFQREGIARESLVVVPHSFDWRDLVSGKVEAQSVYATNEVFYLKQAGFPLQIFSPRAAGIDFYGDNLFTSEREVRDHPQRVKAFRAATLRGWRYAMDHPQEIIALILSQYAPGLTRDFLEFEAAAQAALIAYPQVDLGYMYPGRWQHIADIYAEVGMLPGHFAMEGFLYDPHPPVDLTWLYRLLTAALIAIGLIGGIATYIYRISRRLQASLAELRVVTTALDQSPTAIVVTSADYAIRYVNPQFVQETGYSPAEVLGMHASLLASGQTDAAVEQAMWQNLSRGEPWHGELISRRKSGEVYWEEAHVAPVKDASGRITHFVAVKLDISERKRIQERLAHLAHHDPLTDLPNRALIFEHLEQGLSLARRQGRRLALLFIDLDKFKPINDNLGHAMGDRLLQEVSRRLNGALRQSDRVGRIGGDEFLAILFDPGEATAALAVAEKLHEALRRPFAIDHIRLEISSSMGLALFPEHGKDALTLAKHADYAMYWVKHQGRDQAVVFDPAIMGTDDGLPSG